MSKLSSLERGVWHRAPGAVWGAVVVVAFAAFTQDLLGSMRGAACTLAWLAAVGVGAWLTGYRLIQLVRARRARAPADAPSIGDPLGETALELAAGFLVLIACLFVLGLLGLLRREAAIALLAASFCGPWRSAAVALRERRSELAGTGGAWPGIALLTILGTMTLLRALAPVHCQDALVYHLALPAKYVEAGGLVPVEESFFGYFPQNLELLFTWALLLQGEALAQAMHWLFAVASVAAVAGLSRRICPGADRGLAALTFAAIPTVCLVGGWAYVDLGVVLYVVVSVDRLLAWISTRDLRELCLSAVLAGGAAGIKYTGGLQGLLVVALAFAFELVRKRSLARALTAPALAAALVACVAGPWWVRNLVLTGNPLFPFCYGILGGRGWDEERARVLSLFLKQWGGRDGLADLATLPFRLTFGARFFSEESFDGMVGAGYLILAPVLLIQALRGSRQERTVLSLAAAHFSAWVLLTQQVRFLLPCLALLAALGSAGLGSAARHFGLVRFPLAAASLLNVALSALHFAHVSPLPVVLGLEPREVYLDRSLPGGDYRVFDHIEKRLPSDARILFGSLGNPGYLCKRPYHADAIFENRTLSEILAAAPDPHAAHRELRARGFTHLLFRMDNVFDASGTRSEIPLEDQQKLMVLLNLHAALEVEAGRTYLYDLTRTTAPPRGP